jgi:hypothetical protein
VIAVMEWDRAVADYETTELIQLISDRARQFRFSPSSAAKQKGK